MKYILNYPSAYGMGSDTDAFLVNETDLKNVIRDEVLKKRNGESCSDRLSGSWDKEVFCDSSDDEECIEDVIRKRLTSCSTYAGVKDLLPLPEKAVADMRTDRFYEVIFHLENQFGFGRDVIAGEAEFVRYYVDLSSSEGFGRLFDGKWHEFTFFRLAKVLENHYAGTIEDLIRSEEDRIRRIHDKRKGIKRDRSGTYLDDIVSIGKEQYDRWEQESLATIDKFGCPVNEEDRYLSHLFVNRRNELRDEWMRAETAYLKEMDYRSMYYQYPLMPVQNPGMIYVDNKELSEYYRYDELFKKGADVKSLFAAHTGSGEDASSFEGVDAFRALFGEFGYD